MKVDHWEWEPDVPQDIRDIVLPHLGRWRELIPTWCQDFSIRYDPRTNSLCAVDISYRYRWAVLIITGQWLEAAEEERSTALLHELIHINLEPLTRAGNRVLESMGEGSVARDLANSSHTDGMEESVQDLARGIRRVIA